MEHMIKYPASGNTLMGDLQTVDLSELLVLMEDDDYVYEDKCDIWVFG